MAPRAATVVSLTRAQLTAAQRDKQAGARLRVGLAAEAAGLREALEAECAATVAAKAALAEERARPELTETTAIALDQLERWVEALSVEG